MWVTKQAIISKNRNKHDLKNQPKNLMELKRKEETGGREKEGEGGQDRGRRKRGNDLVSINISNHPLHFSFKGL